MSAQKPKRIRIPRYCLHKASGRAYVTIGGSERYLGTYKLKPDGTPDCPEYHRLIAQWLTGAGGAGAMAAPASSMVLTITELVDRYWMHVQAYYKAPDGTPTGEVDAIRNAMRPLNRLFGETAAQDFGPKRLKVVRDEMRRMGWCRTNINRQVARVRRCFRWGVEEELVEGRIDHALRAVRGLRRNPDEVRESEPVRPVPEPAIEAILPLVSLQVRAMIEVQRLTGMRPGELVIMRTGDIDRTGDVWTYRPSAHKTAHHGKTREVFIGPKGQEHLRPFLRAKPAAFIFDPREAEAERSEKRREERKSPLTPSQVKRDRRTDPATNKGERYTVGSYRRAIARACDKAFPLPADIELDKVADWRRAHRWHPHQLRHNAATHLRKLHGIEAARVILGHESAETTHIYAEQDLQKAREIMGKVG